MILVVLTLELTLVLQNVADSAPLDGTSLRRVPRVGRGGHDHLSDEIRSTYCAGNLKCGLVPDYLRS